MDASKLVLGGALAYGADYNPEQFDDATFERDLELMRQAQVNLVSLGIFSWTRLEPSEGNYRLDWLEQLIDRLWQAGISVDLATATASPPAWLGRHYPDTLPVRADGSVYSWGSRQQYCPSSYRFRVAANALTARLVERFAAHPAVVAWHVSNEYGCHIRECFCQRCAQAWRDWLKKRYCCLDALNRAWGTNFWSQFYTDWEQVIPPRITPSFANPNQMLDWRRFSSDNLKSGYLSEAALIRAGLAKAGRAVPVTTNFMDAFEALDYFDWAKDIDLVTNDSYPDPADPRAVHQLAFTGDLMRGLGGGRPWLLMEQAPGAVQWRARNAVKAPGEYLLWSLAHVAHGADGVMQFQWRQSVAGAETFHGAMVPHSGTQSMQWRQTVELGQVLKRLAPVVGQRSQAQVAIMLDWPSMWAQNAAIGPDEATHGLQIPSLSAPAGSALRAAQAWHATCFEAGYAIDIVQVDAELDDYSLIVVPEIFMTHPQLAQRLNQAASRGAQVVITARTGVVDQSGHGVVGGYLSQGPSADYPSTSGNHLACAHHATPEEAPATGLAMSQGEQEEAPAATMSLAELTGVRVLDQIPVLDAPVSAWNWEGVPDASQPLAQAVAKGLNRNLQFTLDAHGPLARLLARSENAPLVAYGWSENLAINDDVEILASYATGRLAGQGAITRRPQGAGAAWYISCDLTPAARAHLLKLAGAYARLRPVFAHPLPAGVSAHQRGSCLFLLNFAATSAEIAGVVGYDLVGANQVTGHLVLPPRSGAVIQMA